MMNETYNLKNLYSITGKINKLCLKTKFEDLQVNLSNSSFKNRKNKNKKIKYFRKINSYYNDKFNFLDDFQPLNYCRLLTEFDQRWGFYFFFSLSSPQVI